MLNIELLLVSKHGESLLMCPAVLGAHCIYIDKVVCCAYVYYSCSQRLGAHIVYTLIKLFVVCIAVHSDYYPWRGGVRDGRIQWQHWQSPFHLL